MVSMVMSTLNWTMVWGIVGGWAIFTLGVIVGAFWASAHRLTTPAEEAEALAARERGEILTTREAEVLRGEFLPPRRIP